MANEKKRKEKKKSIDSTFNLMPYMNTFILIKNDTTFKTNVYKSYCILEYFFK